MASYDGKRLDFAQSSLLRLLGYFLGNVTSTTSGSEEDAKDAQGCTFAQGIVLYRTSSSRFAKTFRQHHPANLPLSSCSHLAQYPINLPQIVADELPPTHCVAALHLQRTAQLQIKKLAYSGTNAQEVLVPIFFEILTGTLHTSVNTWIKIRSWAEERQE